jgi:hypothetical protein
MRGPTQAGGTLTSSSLRSASSPATIISAAPTSVRIARGALHRRRQQSSAPLLLIAALCIVAGAHIAHTAPVANRINTPVPATTRYPTNQYML